MARRRRSDGRFVKQCGYLQEDGGLCRRPATRTVRRPTGFSGQQEVCGIHARSIVAFYKNSRYHRGVKLTVRRLED